MKSKPWIIIGAFLMVFGGTFLVPLIGAVIFAVGGHDLERFLENSGESAQTIIIVVVVVASISVPVLGMLALFGVILIPYVRKTRRKNRILAEGLAAEARILALEDTATRVNNNPMVSFSLEVYPKAAPTFKAVAEQTVSIIHLPSYQPGRIVNVKYFPDTFEVVITGAKMN